jgi:hypothetical protein
MDLIHLIYVSDLVERRESELGAILASAVRHNAEDGITGMLLYAEGNFLQVLEGDRAQVLATYARICKDPRHANVIHLVEEQVSHRHFANWSMGYKQLRAQDVEKFPRHAPYFRLGFKAQDFQVAPGAALDMLQFFSKGMT